MAARWCPSRTARSSWRCWRTGRSAAAGRETSSSSSADSRLSVKISYDSRSCPASPSAPMARARSRYFWWNARVLLLVFLRQEVRQLAVVARIAGEGGGDRVELQVLFPELGVHLAEIRRHFGSAACGGAGSGGQTSRETNSSCRVITNYPLQGLRPTTENAAEAAASVIKRKTRLEAGLSMLAGGLGFEPR